nr:polysaccharide pyruvyl transferase CsaB [Alkalinema sp. FACHB-956]
MCGYYGMGNAGDEALLVSLLQMLPEHITPVVLSKDPHQTYDRYGVEAYDRWKLGEILKAYEGARYFIWGGGSLMQDTSSAISPLYYAGLMKLAQLMGLQTIAWAQGLGPLHKSYNRWMTRHVLKRCQAVSVRDLGSAGLLSRWQIPHTLAPDPVWAMTPRQSPTFDRLTQGLPRPWVAVNVRQHATLTEPWLELLIQALQQFQQKARVSFVFLPFQQSLDWALAQRLQTQFPDSPIVLLEDPQQVKGIFQKVDLTIAMRLHAVIMAAAEDCRCYALSYDPKVSQVMQALHLPGQELGQLSSDPEVLVQKIVQEWLDLLGAKTWAAQSYRENLIQQAIVHREILCQVMR